jgi:hypothetical protein
MRHGEISVGMFPGYPIDAITNGVHAVIWTSPPFADLFDRRIPEWRQDNFYLRYAVGISPHKIAEAHAHWLSDFMHCAAMNLVLKIMWFKVVLQNSPPLLCAKL